MTLLQKILIEAAFILVIGVLGYLILCAGDELTKYLQCRICKVSRNSRMAAMKIVIGLVCLGLVAFAAFLLHGCAEYDERLIESPSCALDLNQRYTFQAADNEHDTPISVLPDRYIPKCCDEIEEVCRGRVLTISCRQYVETWTVLDSVDGVQYISIENKAPGVTELKVVTAKMVMDDTDAGN